MRPGRAARLEGARSGRAGAGARAAERASALSGAALSRALARQETEAKARILAIMTRALRDLAIADGVRPKRARGVKEDKPRRRRPYQWRPMSAPPSAWAERKRRTSHSVIPRTAPEPVIGHARFARTRRERRNDKLSFSARAKQGSRAAATVEFPAASVMVRAR